VSVLPTALLIAAFGGLLAWLGISSLREERRADQKLKRSRARKARAG
jgi:hypothetical protein